MKELIKIQQSLVVPKNQWNDFSKFKYRSCDDILKAVKEQLGDCQLRLTDELVNIGERYYIKATATFIGSKEELQVIATGYAREEESKKGMDGAQITGTASSYARKYALNALFLIDDGIDADSLDKHEPATKAKPKPAPADPGVVAQFEQCETLDQLQTVWGYLPKESHRTYEGVKNIAKKRLEANK